jgi:hypothetical protein
MRFFAVSPGVFVQQLLYRQAVALFPVPAA